MPLNEEGALLFASFRDCRFPGADNDSGVILFSGDDGSSWRQVLEPILHAEFDYVNVSGEGNIRIFGDRYSEGTAYAPFVLVPGNGEWSWSLHEIYTEAGYLEGVALLGEKHLVAWVRHLELGDDGWDGEIFVHRSDDGGRSWEQLGTASSYPEDHHELRLSRIRRAAKDWRILDDESGGFEIHRQLAGEGTWRTVAIFPWQPCDPPAEELQER